MEPQTTELIIVFAIGVIVGIFVVLFFQYTEMKKTSFLPDYKNCPPPPSKPIMIKNGCWKPSKKEESKYIYCDCEKCTPDLLGHICLNCKKEIDWKKENTYE